MAKQINSNSENSSKEVEIIPEKKEKARFIQVDKNGNIFSNFFSNFQRQFKNSKGLFSFFRKPQFQEKQPADSSAILKTYNINSQAAKVLSKEGQVQKPASITQAAKKSIDIKPQNNEILPQLSKPKSKKLKL